MADSYTEANNPRTRGLDQKSTLTILRLLNREDRRVPQAVARAIPQIARAVERIVERLSRGGRLIYVGAGTSGRLGVLDAAECPPTFGISRRQVQALLAGGRRAFDRAVEGAEDMPSSGRRDVARLRVGPADVVVGITASGRTSYVAGALREAHRRRATTVLVTTNPQPTELKKLADVVITAAVGPEPIAGSTRMKSGTAQKLILNMLSTTAMVRLGRVYDNWMVYVAQTNRKLRRRALSILQQATGATPVQAQRALAAADGELPVALVMLLTGTSASAARRLLQRTGGHVRGAVELGRANQGKRADGRLAH